MRMISLVLILVSNSVLWNISFINANIYLPILSKKVKKFYENIVPI